MASSLEDATPWALATRPRAARSGSVARFARRARPGRRGCVAEGQGRGEDVAGRADEEAVEGGSEAARRAAEGVLWPSRDLVNPALIRA